MEDKYLILDGKLYMKIADNVTQLSSRPVEDMDSKFMDALLKRKQEVEEYAKGISKEDYE